MVTTDKLSGVPDHTGAVCTPTISIVLLSGKSSSMNLFKKLKYLKIAGSIA